MNISDLQSKTIGILGFGQEGSAIAKFLLDNSIEVKIFDKQDQTKLADQYQTQLQEQKLDYFSGPDYLEKAIRDCQIIFRSPGVKIPSPLQKTISEKGVVITSQVEWFFEHCSAKIIGVTGTKGKGTTSSLIYEILKAANLDSQIFLTGNIGKVQPLEILDGLTEKDIAVYELSSFQLEYLKRSPQIGVCLMITEDHLDYHGNTEDYVTAKEAIAKFQNTSDHSIYNIDYPASKLIGELSQGKRWEISAQVDKEVNSGVKINGEKVEFWKDKTLTSNFDCSQRLLRGTHNLENIAAAALVAKILNVEDNVIQNSIHTFQGLEHRLQLVREHKGVKYYNDSISTIPETTIAALKSFNEPVVLMLGGATKNLDYTALLNFLEVYPNLKSIICVGQTGQELYNLLPPDLATKSLGPFNDFTQAVEAAVSQASSGDVVLLSPAATSYDMFNNYKERGEKFIEIISGL